MPEPPMTAYNLKPIVPPSIAASDAREQRRKVLEAAAKVRKENYKRFRDRMQKQEAVTANNDDYPL
jgi:hypothetical protein